jgi:long-subunit fatty acid transport protein
MALSPTLTYKVNERLTLGLGYTHYNSAQTLGALRGDAVRLTTEWSF